MIHCFSNVDCVSFFALKLPTHPHPFDICEKIFSYENGFKIHKSFCQGVFVLWFPACPLWIVFLHCPQLTNLPLWLTVHRVHCNTALHSIMNNALWGKYSYADLMLFSVRQTLFFICVNIDHTFLMFYNWNGWSFETHHLWNICVLETLEYLML